MTRSYVLTVDRHFLDSREQGLLVIPLFTDILPGGGGTMICPTAIPRMAQQLYDNPDGVSPRFTTRADNPKMENETNLNWFCNVAKDTPDEEIVEVTGRVGDIYLLHPLMLHSASNNKLRHLRVITNPPVSLKDPFNFDREDESQYSIVERKTLAALGRDRLQGWKITHERQALVPERLRLQAAMREQELERLQNEKSAPDVSLKEVSLHWCT